MVNTELHNRQPQSLVPVCALALNAEAAAPDWIELVPKGPNILGRDGRKWTMTSPQTVLDFFVKRGLPLPVDFEHASEHKAPKGDPAPAAGWVEELQIRDGSIWGRVDWNDSGRNAIEAREYRFISPVIAFTKAGNIIAVVSAALTNQPNLSLTALNQEEAIKVDPELEEIAKALGLGADVGKDAIVKAINSQTSALTTAQAAVKAPPSLDQFVPRADFDTALNRANTAEAELKTQKDAGQKAAIDTAINAALKAGKITPATVDYHKASCSAEGGLERFNAFVGATPEIAGDAPKGKTEGGKPGVLDAEQKATCRALGIAEDAFLKTLEAQKEEAA